MYELDGLGEFFATGFHFLLNAIENFRQTIKYQLLVGGQGALLLLHLEHKVFVLLLDFVFGVCLLDYFQVMVKSRRTCLDGSGDKRPAFCCGIPDVLFDVLLEFGAILL